MFVNSSELKSSGRCDFLTWRVTLIVTTLLQILNQAYSSPLTIHSPSESQVLIDDSSIENLKVGHQHQNLFKTHEDDKNFLKVIALFVGFLLVFSTIICLCAMYWCVCWALNCPGVPTVQNMLNASSRLRSQRNGKIKTKNRLPDLPPAYEYIIVEQHSFESNSEREEMPPTYKEAIRRESIEIS